MGGGGDDGDERSAAPPPHHDRGGGGGGGSDHVDRARVTPDYAGTAAALLSPTMVTTRAVFTCLLSGGRHGCTGQPV